MLIWEEKSAIRSDAYVVTRVRGTRKALLRYICESWRRDQPHGRKVLATVRVRALISSTRGRTKFYSKGGCRKWTPPDELKKICI